jgi:Tfp pilus assembly protein PilX
MHAYSAPREKYAVRRESGAVLVSGLIILGILLVIGASAMMMSNTQLKIAGNMQHQNNAMAGAESAIAVAENWLNTNYNDPAFLTGTTPGLYANGATVPYVTHCATLLVGGVRAGM